MEVATHSQQVVLCKSHLTLTILSSHLPRTTDSLQHLHIHNRRKCLCDNLCPTCCRPV